ncbi:hypothetical protein PUNSTDRAFT_132157 [Punctularia strigosozonata HHB-11173 SS5]|uniref:uncharacterized protein n=1 Tax=Punctularia strigosozonata (strain HHB-11173) TaxID=741275 RepID=UPI0004417714|nr:uncharacterized protein PUNSTDRAFT_132157 [Punctularia strigosozonata HHB-11173 SS5]EIN12026.1 hypothetical protein PUNSTDRAFT_132157 [Punctularia strigosozonata HHB-11173 SS5]
MPPPTATVGVVPTPRTPRLVEDIKEHDTTIYATSPPGCATPYNFVTPGPYARLIQHPSVSSPYPPSVSLAAVGQGLYHSSPSNLNAQVTDPFARPGPYARQTPSSDLATPSYRGPGRVSPSFSPIPGNSRVETTILALRTDRRPFSTAVFNGESSPFLGQFHDDLDGGGAYRADHHPEWFIHDTPSAPNNIPASPKHYLSQPATRDIYVNDPVLYHAGEETHVRAGSQDEFAVEVDYDTLDFEWRPLKRKNVDSRRSSSPTPETFLTQSLKDRSVLGYSEVEWPTHLRGTRPHGHIARIHQAKTVVSLTPPYDEGLASYEGAGPDMTLNVFYQSHHDSPPPTLRQMQPSSEERVPIATSSSSSLRSNTPDVNEDHTGSPSNAKEPAGPAFAPAPGVYVSPLRTPATQPPPATPSLKAETDEVETPKMKPISAFACRLSVNGVVVDSTTASVSPQSEDSIESWTEDAGIIQ